eukprot:scaffold64882_cov75-Phaeocystis_antarctica.AAC.3
MPETSIAAASHSRSVKRWPRITIEPTITGKSLALFRTDCVGKSIGPPRLRSCLRGVVTGAAACCRRHHCRREARAAGLRTENGLGKKSLFQDSHERVQNDDAATQQEQPSFLRHRYTAAAAISKQQRRSSTHSAARSTSRALKFGRVLRIRGQCVAFAEDSARRVASRAGAAALSTLAQRAGSYKDS